MITLNDYLYSGDTVLRILQKYSSDLELEAAAAGNEIDLVHCSFLNQIKDMLEHNDFLTAQSQKIREFYMHMAKEYPFLAFTFKGRIKSLIRAEEKFNGYIVEYIYDYYGKYHRFPDTEEIKSRLDCFRDLIAYRIVISIPKCHLQEGQSREDEEIRYLYEIANMLPGFMEQRGFRAESAKGVKESLSDRMEAAVRPYYRDYISDEGEYGYRSLHITFYDNSSRSYMEVQLRTQKMDDIAKCFMEVQLRTKAMDDNAEIGPANHLGYEKRQENERARRDVIPEGECSCFDEAYERGMRLQQLALNRLDVNMFSAVNNSLINDGCGLYRGRLILPYEHLSRFQNDLT